MHLCLRTALLYIYSSCAAIDRGDTPEVCAIWEVQCVSCADVRLLPGVVVTIDGAFLCSTDTAKESQTGDCRSFIQQLRVRKVAQTEKLPPRGLCFAPVPVQ